MDNIREGYKETEIGVIPEEWTHEKLKNLCTKITDGTHKTPKYTDSGIPFLRVTDIQTKEINWSNVKYISKEEHKDLIKRCNPEFGDILYSKNGTIGIPKIIDWNREFSIFVSLCLIKVKEGAINKKFLEQFLKSDNCLNQIKLRAKQGTVKNLHLVEIRELDIAIPTAFQQQRIAEILSITDEHIEKLDKIIEDYKLIKKGMMQKLLTKGIGHTEFKDSEIGRLPKEWEMVELKELVEFYNGKAHENDVNENGDYIIINSKFVSSDGAVEKYTDACMFPLFKNDIVMVMSDIPNGKAIAKTFLVSQNDKYTLNQRICCFRNIKCNCEFMNYVINRNKYYLKFDDGVKQTNLRKDEVLKLKVQVPPFQEQVMIAEIIRNIEMVTGFICEEREDFKLLKKSLMEKLLTGKIRVNTLQKEA